MLLAVQTEEIKYTRIYCRIEKAGLRIDTNYDSQTCYYAKTNVTIPSVGNDFSKSIIGASKTGLQLSMNFT